MFIIYHLIVGICAPEGLVNGRVEYNRLPANGSYPFNTTASLYCNEGYSFNLDLRSQPYVRTCQESGNWTLTNPTCDRGEEFQKLPCLSGI